MLLISDSKINVYNLHIRTVHLDIIKIFFLTNECTSDCLKNNIKIYIKIAP